MWTTDAGGNWLSQTGAMSGTTYAMQSLETTYNQDLNGDGTVGLKVATIEAIGTVDLKQVADTFFLYDHGTTTGPQLKMSGAAVTVGQFDTWTPLGVEKTGNGYLAVWKHGAADEYTVWTIDSGGNWLSQSAVTPGSSAEIQSLEPGFNQDLNGVGGITARFVIDSIGSTTLASIANVFMLSATGNSLGPQLRLSGALVTAGQFGAYTPIAAEASGGGYKVAWKNGPTDQYLVWTTDAGGNWLSQTDPMAGTTYAMQSLETTFGQDLNADGTVGPKVTTIEAIGTVDLKQVADTYFLYDHSSINGPQLKFSGAAVTVGQFDTWTPLGAEKMGKRLSGRLEARRRRRVHRVDHRRRRQLALAECAGVWLERRDPIARTRLQPEPQRGWRHHDPLCHRVPRIDHPGHHCERLYGVSDRQLAGPPAQDVRRALHGGAERRMDADRRRGGWQRLPGRLEERRRRSVPRVGHRRRRQLAVANRRDGGASPELKAFENIFHQDLNLSGAIGSSLMAPSSLEASAEFGPAGSNMALFTSYMASAFATPAGDGTGIVADPQSSLQSFLAKPSA